MIKWDLLQDCKVGLTYENQSTTLIEWKEKKPAWLLILTGKAYDKIQHPFMINASNKIGIEGNFLNLIKDIYEKLTLNIILSGKRQSSPLDQEQDEDAIFIISIQHCIGSSI